MFSCFQSLGLIPASRCHVFSNGGKGGILKSNSVRIYSSDKSWKHRSDDTFKAQRNFGGSKFTKRGQEKKDASRPAHILNNSFESWDSRAQKNKAKSPLERLEQDRATKSGYRSTSSIKDALDKIRIERSIPEKASPSSETTTRSSKIPLRDGAIPTSKNLEKLEQADLQQDDHTAKYEIDDSIYDIEPMDDAALGAFDESMAKEREIIRNTAKYLASHYRKETPRYGKKSRPLRTIQADYELLDTEGEDLVLTEPDYTLKQETLEEQGILLDDIKLDPHQEDQPLDYSPDSIGEDQDLEPPAEDGISKPVIHGPKLSNDQVLFKRIIDQADPSEFIGESDECTDTKKSIPGDSDLFTPVQLRTIRRLLTGSKQTYSSINQYIISSKLGLFQCAVEVFERILTERQKRKLVQIRRTRRAELKKAKSWEKRRALLQKRKESQSRAKKRKMLELEKLKNDPNMFYYPDFDCWLSREDLLNPIVRNAVSSIFNNPSWHQKDKKRFVDRVRNTVARLKEGPSKKDKLTIETILDFKGEETEAPESVKDYDHYLAFPTTDWNTMISEIESMMEPLDVAAKYDPPPPPDKKRDVIPPSS